MVGAKAATALRIGSSQLSIASIPVVVAIQQKLFEAEGITVRINAECIRFESQGAEIAVGLDCASGAPVVTASHVLLAVGRRANAEVGS